MIYTFRPRNRRAYAACVSASFTAAVERTASAHLALASTRIPDVEGSGVPTGLLSGPTAASVCIDALILLLLRLNGQLTVFVNAYGPELVPCHWAVTSPIIYTPSPRFTTCVLLLRFCMIILCLLGAPVSFPHYSRCTLVSTCGCTASLYESLQPPRLAAQAALICMSSSDVTS